MSMSGSGCGRCRRRRMTDMLFTRRGDGRGLRLWRYRSCGRLCRRRFMPFMLTKDSDGRRESQAEGERYFLHFHFAEAPCERPRDSPYSLTLLLFLFHLHLTGIATTTAASIFV